MPMRMLFRRSALAAVCLAPLALAACGTVAGLRRSGAAGETMVVSVSVRDPSGAPVKDAVVSAVPLGGPPGPAPTRPRASVTLEGYAFRPTVLPVRVGTGVTFVNRDQIDHQVYSISAAKNFDVLARRGSSSAEVVFDRPGVAVVGCVSHDQSVGHVCVLETPYFATSGADGLARLRDLPRGAYNVRVWHPGVRAADAPPAQRVADVPPHGAQLSFSVSIRRAGDPAQPLVAPGRP